jgi:ribosomal protein S18 acetylase RimI-like enzyme
MRFSYHEYGKYNEEEIVNLYKSVGWTTYAENPSMLKGAYSNSLYILGAYDGEKLIGIIRVVGDGFSIIFIQDILVLPEYQRKGIGTALVKDVLEKYAAVYQCELLTDNTEKTISFYKSLGFRPANELGCLSFLKM